MKKGLIYYFVVVSLVLHLLTLLGIGYLPWDLAKRTLKEKEPIAIDLVGPAKHADVTQVPKLPEKTPNAVNTSPEDKRTEKPLMTARAKPQKPAPATPLPRPSLPPPPSLGRPAPAGPQLPEHPSEQMSGPAPDSGAVTSETPPSPSSPQSPAAGKPASPSAKEPPRRLVQPSIEDLMRYAQVDKRVKRVEPDQGITLDTDDLKYTSYMQGLKRRIELIWKYPDTAQKDGLQGELVMRFAIAKSGRVEDIELLKSSGYPILDNAARQALNDASPFNPLPDSWGKDRFIITGTFVYRMYGLYIR